MANIGKICKIVFMCFTSWYKFDLHISTEGFALQHPASKTSEKLKLNWKKPIEY